MVVGQTRPLRRQRPIHHRTRRLADLDLRCAAPPRHDTTATRAHTEILPALTDAGADLRTLGDLGYEGLADTVTVAFKRPKNGGLLLVQQQFNKAHNSRPAVIGERGNSLLKMSFRALRNISLNPWRNREDRRSRAGHPPHRAQPNDMTFSSQFLARTTSLSQ